MKKIILLTGALAMTVLVSCKDNQTDPPPPPEPVVHDEPAPVPPPPEPEAADGTSIQVGSDGVSLDTKDGTRSTSVDVRDGGAAVEIKK